MMTLPPPTHTDPTATLPDRGPAPPLPSPTRPLLALIKLELRQNAPLAAGIAAALLVAAIFAFQSDASSLREQFNILLFGPVAFLLSAAPITIGFALGIAQPLHERHFDLWALRIHRPITRTLLFTSRILAGLLLYSLLIVLPVLLLIAIAATSTGGLFFQPSFAAPALADLLNGLLFYLAGLLCSQRQAFLLGSRGLPLIFAITAALAAYRLFHLSSALLLEALACLLLLLAAHGSALSHGYTLRRPLPKLATPALALALLIALSAILFLVTSATRDLFVTPLQQAAVDSVPPPPLRIITTHILLSDGSIGILTDTYHGTRETLQLTDSAGNPRPLNDRVDDKAISLYRYQNFPHPYRDPGAAVTQHGITVRPGLPETIWYALPDAGLIRGFQFSYDVPNHLSATPVGTLGASGFTPPGPPPGTSAEPFHNAIIPGWFDQPQPTSLDTIDLDHRTVTQRFTAPPGEHILAYTPAAIADGLPQAGPGDADLIATASHLTILNGTRTLFTLPITHDLTTWNLRVYPLPESHHLAVWYHQLTPNTPADIEIYDPATATLLSKQSIPHVQTTEIPDEAAYEAALDSAQRNPQRLDSALFALGNPLFAIAAAFLGLTRVPPNPLLTPILIILLASGFFTLTLALRYRLRAKAALWTLLALLTGPAALLTMISIHPFPRRVRCKTCNALRHPTAPCPNAHAPDLPPPPSPTEIFA